MRYSFADCILDTDRRELRRAGRVVATRPKVYQVLSYLVEQRDRVVSKDELLSECWPGRVVGDATLNSVLKEIRRAVGDSGKTQRFLKTLHGQGYRFVAELAGVAPEPEAPGSPGAEPPPGGAAPPSQSEHKQVTVLACRIDDSGRLAEELGPERMDALMREFFATATRVLTRYGGSVTQWEGDGFTALFGAPRALEDHARRAVAAALELRAALASGEQLPGVGLGAGLHTGPVVVGSLHDTEQLYTALGPTTGIAHGIRRQAGPTIVASAALHELIESEVAGQPRSGPEDLPALFEITELAVQHGGVPRRGAAGRSRFVGRGDEVALALTRLELAQGGSGNAVCVSGEPGIGKSRLLRELSRRLDGQALTRVAVNCLAYRQPSPWFVIQRVLRGLCGMSSGDDAAAVLKELGARAAAAGLATPGLDTLRAVFEMPGDPDREALNAINANQVMADVNRLLLHTALQQPLVLVLEDLHWIDTSSERWLTSFVQSLPTAPVLLLATFRPGYQSDWLAQSHVTQIALPRLNDADSAALIRSLPTELPESAEVYRHIVNHAQGNPFFLEELTFSAANPGDGDVVPTTVQAVLGSRIDQLEPGDKALLQCAAVIGATVPHALLRAVANDAGLEERLARLQQREFLLEDPAAAQRGFRFRHALTRDVAYRSLLAGLRRERHRDIAETVVSQFPRQAEMEPELVAHHFSEAGVPERAMHYWNMAGLRAVQRSANPEAVVNFERALEASEALPVSRTLKKQQLELYLQLGVPLMSSKAFTSPAVEAAYGKARRLCQEVGTRSQLLTVLWGLWLHFAHRGRIGNARALAQNIVSIADDVDDDGLRLQAHHAVWTTEIWHGDLALCEQHARAGIALYDEKKHESHRRLYGGHDPGVCALGTAAIAAWFRGRPQESIELTQAGADLADKLDHPYSRIITLHDFMEIEALRGNAERSGHYGRLAIDACTEHQVPNYLAVGHIFAGYGAAAGGEFDAGLAQLKDGLEHYRSLGAERNLAPYLLLLAELCQTPERCADGLAAVDEAAALIARTGEIRWQPEILRLHGELLRLQADENTATARGLFEQALDISREHGCTGFELRAATSLARRQCDDGEPAGARETLGPVYAKFDEGFDTRDLRDAAALLEALA